ncbi:MAG TPA: MFS transporter [Candidatus Sulfotelmatobacter sp.]|nr:MFS transporter [Candidatus Sulfotelmatobacter sp.]
MNQPGAAAVVERRTARSFGRAAAMAAADITSAAGGDGRATFTTDVPGRLDRLPWSGFHRLVILALGITWILDGLEVTLVGSLSGKITESTALGLTSAEVGFSASAYLLGAVLGALVFGYLADRWGRKRLFTITLAVYAAATVLTGLAWNFVSFASFRFATGAGIGGEYSAINSAIQELMPARFRGLVDLSINGSFWLGGALGAIASLVVLQPGLLPDDLGWRVAFLIGGVLALIIIFLRRYLPESPRWLMTHGRADEAAAVVAEIEQRVGGERGFAFTGIAVPAIRLVRRGSIDLAELMRALFVRHARRAVLGVVLMASQAFCYNAIFFTYALVLTRYYGVPADGIGWFILAFSLGNFMGPLCLGRLFDSLGRKTMIAGTYALSGVLMAVIGLLFQQDLLGAAGQTVAWTVFFFFASAAASSAYLTVGESFPLELRALAIAIFYAFGTAVGGLLGPFLFGLLIESGSRLQILWGYLLGAVLMLLAAVAEARLGIAAERRPLEAVARPIASAEDEARL